MGGITAHLLRQFRNWERPARIAFFSALGMLIVVIALGAVLPPEARSYALIGVFGLVIVIEFIFMWANRGMVKPYTRAQRLYLAGDFEAARDVLVQACDEGECGANELTLLGNIHRQMGDLEKSKESLTQAIELKPNYHFPLYGFGRTLLVEGCYTDAVRWIEQALEAGAPPTVQADLGEALYRADAESDRAVDALQAARESAASEPHRALMVALLLNRLGVGPVPDSALIAEGLPYWEATAVRFEHTPYGIALAEDVRDLREQIGERS